MLQPAAPRSGSRPCSEGNGLQRSSSRGDTGGSTREERARAKFVKLESMYDFPEATKSRVALSNKVLGCSPDRAKKDDARPQSELINDWLCAERVRADKISEKHWKDKFVEWHTQLIAKPGTEPFCRSPKNLSDSEQGQSFLSPESVGWKGLDPNDPEVLAIRKQAELFKQGTTQLCTKQKMLERDISRFGEELEEEQLRRTNLDEMLLKMTEDRDAWNASAERHDIMRKRFLQEQHETNAQVAEMHDQLATIRNTLTVEEARLPAT